MSSLWPVTCAHCGTVSFKPVGAVNRAEASGLRLFCNRECSGFGRRKHKSRDQLVAEKAAYDRRRRARLGDALLAKKRAAYHAAVAADPTGTRERERQHRAKRAGAHAEYCRRPEYREWKRDYDRKHRANKQFGPYAEAFLALQDLEAELETRASKYERYAANGTLNKTQKRKRAYEQATLSRHSQRRTLGHAQPSQV